MNQEKSGKHIIDSVFVICLLLLFLISALTVIAIGASIYKKNVQQTTENYAQRISFAYVTEKIRQADQNGMVFVTEKFDRNVLVLQEDVDGELYNTYIYGYQDYLCELYARDDLEYVYPQSGQKILKIDSFDIKEIDDGLLLATIKADGSNEESVFIAVKSRSND